MLRKALKARNIRTKAKKMKKKAANQSSTVRRVNATYESSLPQHKLHKRCPRYSIAPEIQEEPKKPLERRNSILDPKTYDKNWMNEQIGGPGNVHELAKIRGKKASNDAFMKAAENIRRMKAMEAAKKAAADDQTSP
jgi:hypothetical protein